MSFMDVRIGEYDVTCPECGKAGSVWSIGEPPPVDRRCRLHQRLHLAAIAADRLSAVADAATRAGLDAVVVSSHDVLAVVEVLREFADV